MAKRESHPARMFAFEATVCMIDYAVAPLRALIMCRLDKRQTPMAIEIYWPDAQQAL